MKWRGFGELQNCLSPTREWPKHNALRVLHDVESYALIGQTWQLSP